MVHKWWRACFRVIASLLNTPKWLIASFFKTLKVEFRKHGALSFIDIAKEIWANLTFIAANKKRGNYDF